MSRAVSFVVLMLLAYTAGGAYAQSSSALAEINEVERRSPELAKPITDGDPIELGGVINPRTFYAMVTLCIAGGIGLLVLGVSGCGQPTAPLRVGANAWPGYEPMFLAKSLGYYEGESIQLVNLGSTADVENALRNGLLDVAAVTLDEALSLVSMQPEQYRIVLVCDVSNGADVILAKPEFRSMADLKGRRVAVEATAVGIYVLARALEISGLSETNVKILSLTNADQPGAVAADQVDAVVTFEPHRTRLLATGMRQVFDSTQIHGEVVDVLLTRRELTGTQCRQLRALTDGWFRSLDYLRANPSDAAERVAGREGVSPQEFLDSLKWLDLMDRAANLRLLGSAASTLPATFRRLDAVMTRHNLLPRQHPPGVLLLPYWDEAFVAELQP